VTLGSRRRFGKHEARPPQPLGGILNKVFCLPSKRPRTLRRRCQLLSGSKIIREFFGGQRSVPGGGSSQRQSDRTLLV
jgi:hypothetical protein